MSWSLGQELSQRHPESLYTPPEAPVALSALLSILVWEVNISAEATGQSKSKRVCNPGHTKKNEVLSPRLLNGCRMSHGSHVGCCSLRGNFEPCVFSVFHFAHLPSVWLPPPTARPPPPRATVFATHGPSAFQGLQRGSRLG